MEMHDVCFSFFQKSSYESSYHNPYEVYASLLRSSFQQQAGRRRKLEEVGFSQLYNYPIKKLATAQQSILEKDRIDKLPDELLRHIFGFLSSPEDRFSCAFVCKKWLVLQSRLPASNGEVEPGDLKRTLEGKRANDVRLVAAALGTLGRGGLGKLAIRSGPKQKSPVTNLGMAAVGACCRSLKVLSLWDCPSINDVGFSFIANGCKQLQVLNVFNCPGFGDGALQAIAAGCPLRNLSLEHCGTVTDNGLEAVAANCSKELSALSLVSCKRIQDAGVISILAKCEKLKALRLDKLGLTDASLAFVGEHGRSIVKLKLGNLELVSNVNFGKMEQLKQLTVASCVGLDGGFLNFFGKESKLQKLTLSDFKSLDSDKVLSFFRTSEALEGVCLERCSLVSPVFPAAATPMDANSVTVRSLSFRQCQGVRSLLACVAGASSLDELDLSGFADLTDEELNNLLASGKSGLATLNLSGCVKLTDNAVAAIISFCPSLEQLNLEGCCAVTDEGIGLLGQACHALRELYIGKCTISDKGILELVASRGPFLRTLSLTGCAYITDRCLVDIEDCCSVLEALNLKGCNKISMNKLQEFEYKKCSCQLLC